MSRKIDILEKKPDFVLHINFWITDPNEESH